MGKIAQSFNVNWQSNNWGDQQSWMHQWDPRVKLISLVLFIFGVVSLNSLSFVLCSLISVLVAILIVKIPWTILVKRITWVIPFLLFIFVGLLINRGFENLQDSLYFASLISLKALTSIMVTTLMVGTLSLEEILRVVAQLKVPQTIVGVLFLSYRYIHLYRDIFLNTRKALVARGFHNQLCLQTLKVYGEVTGALFIKALDRSELVYRSMEARGFDGSIPVGCTYHPLKVQDVLIGLMVVGLITVILAIDRGVVL